MKNLKKDLTYITLDSVYTRFTNLSVCVIIIKKHKEKNKNERKFTT